MKKYKLSELSSDELMGLLQRPNSIDNGIRTKVQGLLSAVKLEGDIALIKYAREFDNLKNETLPVEAEEIVMAEKKLDPKLRKAIREAARNIRKFHEASVSTEKKVSIVKGVKAWRKNVAIEKVGLYVPGGTAPLFSTVLMLGIPASIAGCKQIVICSPPSSDGIINPAILFAAKLCGIKKIFKCGGAQAIAAMAYGTETIPAVYKIFGPGNQFVTQAKQLVQLDGVAIDMPAGPSEVAILADSSALPSFVAADLLSQAEHGPDSQVILVTDSANLASEVSREMEKQIIGLPRRDVAAKALANSKTILVSSMNKGLEVVNLYAPEHLILACKKANQLAEKVTNAGSVFIGNYSCESLGDYASGPNHTLPTNGYARAYSGVSVDSFLKKITFQEVNKAGIRNLGQTVITMAQAEGLQAHANAVKIRLKT